MSALLVFVVVALGTYGIRISMVVGGVGEHIDDAWSDRLALVAPVMLGAMVTSSLFVSDAAVTLPGAAEIVAVTASALAVRRTGSLAVAFLAGFPVYWLVDLLG